MLADYTRRYREYTGPTPHSVAIVSLDFSVRLCFELLIEFNALYDYCILRLNLCSVLYSLSIRKS